MSDDLTRIRGISPKLAARLNEAGITTFKQIAESPPHTLLSKLGNTPGITIETIKKRNWSGQASELAKHSNTDVATRSADLEAKNYVIELFTDRKGEIRRTRIYNVESREEEMWDGWDSGRITGFFEMRLKLTLTSRPAETEIPGALIKQAALAHREVTTETRPANPAAASSSLTESPLHLQRMNLFSTGEELPTRTIDHERPFYIRLDMETGHAPALNAAECDFTVNVYAKSLEGGRNYTVTNEEGRCEPGEHFTINVKSADIPPGFYELAATLKLNPVRGKAGNRLRASVDGGIVEFV